MQVSVRIKRLTAATLICVSLVLGISMLVGAGKAQSSGGPARTHTCSAADKQFLQTVESNMTQLGYWSDELVSGDVAPGVVIKQTHSEAMQVDATSPTDQSLSTARSLLRKMFLEYGAAVKAKALGNSPGRHVQTAYSLANAVHDLLVAEQPEMSSKGCDLSALLAA